MLNLTLIRGTEHGLLPVHLLTEITEQDINIRTISEREMPGMEEVVLVDRPDPQDSLACIRRLRAGGCWCFIILVAPEERLPAFHELAPLLIAAVVPTPVQREVLSAALQQAAAQVQSFNSRYIPRSDYVSLQESLRLQRMERMYRQITGGETACLESLDAFNTAFGSDFEPGPLACFGIQADPAVFSAEVQSAWPALAPEIRVFFRAHGLYAEQLQMAGFCGCLFSPAGQSLSALAGELYAALRRSLPPADHLTVSLAGPAADISALPLLFQNAVDGLRNRISLGTDRVIDITAGHMTDYPASRILSTDRMIALCASIDVGDLDSVEQQILQAVEALAEVPQVSAQSVYTLAMRFYEIFRDSSLHGLECGARGNSDAAFFLQLDSCSSLEQLAELLTVWCRKLLDSAASLPAGPISQSLRYINASLSRPLSLQDIARRAGLSPSYYGTLFKQQMGCTFIEYVQTRRISASTRLLAESDRTIADIARSVGFSDYRYFSRLFTRITGMTPTQYRRQHLAPDGTAEQIDFPGKT